MNPSASLEFGSAYFCVCISKSQFGQEIVSAWFKIYRKHLVAEPIVYTLRPFFSHFFVLFLSLSLSHHELHEVAAWTADECVEPFVDCLKIFWIVVMVVSFLCTLSVLHSNSSSNSNDAGTNINLWAYCVAIKISCLIVLFEWVYLQKFPYFILLVVCLCIIWS